MRNKLNKWFKWTMLFMLMVGFAYSTTIIKDTGITVDNEQMVTNSSSGSYNISTYTNNLCTVDDDGDTGFSTIQSCVDYIDSGTVVVKSGRYTCFNITKAGIKVIGEDMPVIQLTSGQNCIQVSGASTGSWESLTANTVKGNDTVHVASTAGFEIGDIVQLASDLPTGTDNINRSIFRIVENVTSTVITLETPVSLAFNTANSAKIRTYSLLEGIEISGLYINGTDRYSTSERCMSLLGTRNAVIHDNTFTNCGAYGILSGYNYRPQIYRNDFSNIMYGGLGYGVSLAYVGFGSQVYDNYFHHVDEVQDCGGSSVVYGAPEESHFYNNVVEGSEIDTSTNGIDCHDSCDYYYIENNLFKYGTGDAIRGACNNIIIRGNRIEEYDGYAVWASGTNFDSGTVTTGLIIENNDFIRISDTDKGGSDDVVYIQNVTNPIVNKNTFLYCGNPTEQTVDLIITQNSYNFTVTNNLFIGSNGQYRTIYINEYTGAVGYLGGNEFYDVNGAEFHAITTNASDGTKPSNCTSEYVGSNFKDNDGDDWYCDGSTWVNRYDGARSFTTLDVSGRTQLAGIADFSAGMEVDGSAGSLAESQIYWTEGGSGQMQWTADYSRDQFVMWPSSGVGNALILGGSAGDGQDFDHANQVNPTLYIHSATAPDTQNDEWISFSHDQTDGVIDVGTGRINMNDQVEFISYTMAKGGHYIDANAGVDNTASLRWSEGESAVANFEADYGRDQLVLWGSAQTGNQLVFGDDDNKDYDHASQTNPTLFIHSATDPDSANDEWVSIHHNTTDAKIETGSGNVYIQGGYTGTCADGTALTVVGGIITGCS